MLAVPVAAAVRFPRRWDSRWSVEIERDRDPDGMQFSHVRWILCVTIFRLQFQVSWAGGW